MPIEMNTLLQEGNCFSCLGLTQGEVIIIALLQRIAENGGGGVTNNDFRAENYGGAEPTYTPVGTLGIAVDTSNDRVWTWYSGAWH